MATAQEQVREIRIDGAQRVEPSTVLTYIDIRVGDFVTEEILNDSLKKLFSTGLFADISMRLDRSILFVEIVENPIINQIAFEGNKRIEDEELLAEIALRPRQVFTRTKVQSDVARLYQVYSRNGRFSVNIEPKAIQLDQNRVNIVFEIDEGDITKIESIRFVGNKAFDDDKLRSVLSSKETRWYRFITADDRYDPDRLNFDRELLRRFYLQEGYADFEIISANAELSPDQSKFFLTFTVTEGQRYRVGQVSINSNLRGFDSAVLRDSISFLPGEWYNEEEVQTSIDAMTDKLGDLQYAFVTVRRKVDRNKEAGTIDITFEIGESPRVFVERIDINGNVRTLDKVIRRELTLVEGDPFNRSKLERSEQKLRDLGFFQTVEVRNLPGSTPDRTIIDITVTEQSTGELSVGAGFSSTDGPLADLTIRERNLLGKGQSLAFSTTIAGERTEFDASFTEPYFLDRDLSAGVDAFHVTRDLQDESSFDQERTGGGLRLGYPLSEKWRQSWRYRYERNEITDVSADASRFIQEQEGERDTSAISQRITYDDRDSVLFTTEGLYSWLDVEAAGLGGDAQYVSGKLGSTYFHPLFDRDVIFQVLGEVGAIEGFGDEDVKINERYYIGGSTLRGFARAGIGPRDSSTDDSLGGNLFYRGSAELSFPVGLSEDLGVKGHAFTDFGSLWQVDDDGPTVLDENSIRAAAGVGLSWRSPLGPIRVDVSMPYLEEDYDETETLRFDFGTRF